MLYKKNQAEKLEDSLFEQPTAEYRGAPFWAWNTMLEQKRARQADGDLKVDGLWRCTSSSPYRSGNTVFKRGIYGSDQGLPGKSKAGKSTGYCMMRIVGRPDLREVL